MIQIGQEKRKKHTISFKDWIDVPIGENNVL
jgi:hypothetical protein